MQETGYERLGGRQRLAVLEALLAVVAETETVRGHMLQAATSAQDLRELETPGPQRFTGFLGCDASGMRYHLLAGDTGVIDLLPAWIFDDHLAYLEAI